MTSREEIRRGLGNSIKKNIPVRSEPTISSSQQLSFPTIVLPNAKKLCSIILFFVGSFAIGFGSGFGTGYAVKECV